MELNGENIKKEIIGFLNGYINAHGTIAMNEWVIWLEKQCKPKSNKNIIDVWKEMRFEVLAQAFGSNFHEPTSSDENTKIFSIADIDEIFSKIVDIIEQPK
jgi:hypothetical protein